MVRLSKRWSFCAPAFCVDAGDEQSTFGLHLRSLISTVVPFTEEAAFDEVAVITTERELWRFVPPEYYFERKIVLRSIDLPVLPFGVAERESKASLEKFLADDEEVAVTFYRVQGFYSHFYHTITDAALPIFQFFAPMAAAGRLRHVYVGWAENEGYE